MAVSDELLEYLKNNFQPKFGSSDTNPTQLDAGALQNLIDNVAPKRKPIDPALLGLIASAEMVKESSKPGATALGGFGSGILKATGVKIQDDASLAKDAQTRALTGVKLASALKPKTGKPSTIRTGVATGTDGKPQYDKDGKLLYKFQTFDASGNAISSFEAPATSGSTTNINTKEDTLTKEFGKLGVKNLFGFYVGEGSGQNKQPGVIGKAQKASTDLAVLNQIKSLLGKTDTGFGQGTINSGKALLNRLGFNFDETEIGIGQSLQSLTSGMVLQSVSQMKGALSDRELGFLQSMQANIGNTKAGNYLITLSAERGIKKNLQWQDFFNKFKEDKGIDKFAPWNRMGKDTKDNVKLAEELQTKYEDFLVKDTKNLYQFLLDDKKSFVKRMRDQDLPLNEIQRQVQENYFFTNDKGKRVDALKFIKPLFDVTIGE